MNVCPICKERHDTTACPGTTLATPPAFLGYQPQIDYWRTRALQAEHKRDQFRADAEDLARQARDSQAQAKRAGDLVEKFEAVEKVARRLLEPTRESGEWFGLRETLDALDRAREVKT